MNPVLFVVIFLLGCSNNKEPLNYSGIRCMLSSDKHVYKTGELPRLTVQIHNETNEAICLIGALDGSDVKMRFPYCYYTIDGPPSNKKSFGRCGNMNTLREEDFRKVEAGQCFNPYEDTDEYGFSSDNITTDPETFKQPGTYKIQFHYSTKVQDINNFMGDKPFDRDESESIKINILFEIVPRVELASNIITVVVQ